MQDIFGLFFVILCIKPPHFNIYLLLSYFLLYFATVKNNKIMRKLINYLLRVLLSAAIILLAIHWDTVGIVLALPIYLIWEH